MASDPYEEKEMKILVGYDGSAPSKEDLKLAWKHAAAFGGMVDVVTSMEKGTANQRQDMEKALLAL
jgi:nucleotide-binding universal stress UspA family protein